MPVKYSGKPPVDPGLGKALLLMTIVCVIALGSGLFVACYHALSG